MALPDFSSRSFSSPTRFSYSDDPMYGIRRQPPLDGKLLMQLLYHGELPTPPWFRFMVSLPRFSRWGLNFDFVELCNILYTTGPATLVFVLKLACQHSRKVAWEIFLAFHWTLKWKFQCQLLPPRRERGSLAWESELLTNRLAETAFISKDIYEFIYITFLLRKCLLCAYLPHA